MTSKVFAAGLVAVVAFGCSDPPTTATALGDVAVAPAFMATHNAWVETWDLTGEVWDKPACGNHPGEQATNYGTLEGQFRTVTNPSGNEVWQWKVNYYTDTPLHSIGHDSGDRWDLLRAEDNGGSISKAQGTQYVEHWQANEWWVNQDGETFHIRLKFALTIDADGNVQVERFDFRCFG